MEAKFLSDIIKFLKEVQWVYDFPMTQVFTRNVLESVPEEWSSVFADITLDSLNVIPEGKSEENWPPSLKDFLRHCNELSLHLWLKDSPHEFSIDGALDLKVPRELCKGMSVKKRHEVESMVCCIKHLADITKCSRVLDIGSGMGYVDSALHHTLKLTVLGAESKDCRVRNAQSRQAGLRGACKGIRHINWVVGDDQATLDRAEEITQELKSCDVLCTCDLKHLRTQKDLCDKDSPSDFESEAKNPLEESESNNLKLANEQFGSKEANNPLEESESNNLKPTTEQVGSKDSKSVMLIGLHSCADLSPVMMRIFQHCSDISSLVLFSCCYHKLKEIEGKEELCQSDNIVSGVGQSAEHSCSPRPTKIAQKNSEETLESASQNSCSSTSASTGAEELLRKGISTADRNTYSNFPMSQTLEQIMKEKDFQLTIFGLRLASQESGVRWLQHSEEDHKSHEKNVTYRALLEAFCQREGLDLKKRRRRCARKSNFRTFDEYIKTVIENYEFIPCTSVEQSSPKININVTDESYIEENVKAEEEDCETSEEKNPLSPDYIRDGLGECYRKYEHMFPLIEPLTGLQLALQPVIEALVLVDRVLYLKENQFEKVWLESVFDVAISPRNVALVAVR